MRAKFVLSVVTALVVLLGSSPAYAQTVTVQDPRHDVVDDTGEQQRRAPTERRSDVKKLVIEHTRGSLRLTLFMSRPFGRKSAILAGFQIGTATDFYQALVSNQGRTKGAVLSRGKRKVRCKGMRFSARSSTATLRVVIPRTCIKSPSAVRVAAYFQLLEQPTDTFHTYVDVAGQRGLPKGKLHISRAVKVGR